ncbi:MAG: endonuclease I family protein [Planctomycetota bacterium]|jgi:endonuclease I
MAHLPAAQIGTLTTDSPAPSPASIHSLGWRALLRPAVLLWACGSALAQAPAGYYDSVDTSSSTALRATLHAVIDDHQRFPYTSGGTDTWDILELAQEDPNNGSRILDVYKNDSYSKQGGGNSLYNREHTWPRSYGFPDDNGSNYPFTDCHQLHLCNIAYNSSRDNKPFRDCSPSCAEEETSFNNGLGGGTGVYPGNSNWTSGGSTSGTWEVWSGRRGDIARSLLYLDVRYEGGNHGVTGANEPDLILTDNNALIASSITGSNESIAYMGELSVLLQWHFEDPVDDFERERNDVVYSFQGNRNPFVDHPEWVDCVFNGACGVDPVVEYYGCGFNVIDSLLQLGGQAKIGNNWTLGVDNPVGVVAPGSLAFLAISTAPDPNACGTLLPGWGMSGPLFPGSLLISLTTADPLILEGPLPWTGPGAPASFGLGIPADPKLVGVTFYCQGLIVDATPGLSSPFGLSQALMATLGS